MSDTASNMTHLAIGVVGQNIVIDCGSHDEAVRLVETVRVGYVAGRRPVCDYQEDSVRGDIGGPCRRPPGHEGEHDPFYDKGRAEEARRG